MVRSASSAAGFTVAGWIYLVAAGPTLDVPFGQRAVPSPLIWPAAAAVSTMLLSRSGLADWEARATRRLWPYRLGAVFACVLINIAALVALTPPVAQLSLLIWFTALQAAALACSIACGDRAWLPLTAVILVAMFELAQDGSGLLRLIDGAGTSHLVITSSAVAVLATIAAGDRAPRRGRP